VKKKSSKAVKKKKKDIMNKSIQILVNLILKMRIMSIKWWIFRRQFRWWVY